LSFTGCWGKDIIVPTHIEADEWGTDEVRKQVERLILVDGLNEEEDEETRFRSSAKILALISMTDPVGHVSAQARGEAREKRWMFSKEYFWYSAEFRGKNVSASVDTSKVVQQLPRPFSVKILDVENVSTKKKFNI